MVVFAVRVRFCPQVERQQQRRPKAQEGVLINDDDPTILPYDLIRQARPRL